MKTVIDETVEQLPSTEENKSNNTTLIIVLVVALIIAIGLYMWYNSTQSKENENGN